MGELLLGAVVVAVATAAAAIDLATRRIPNWLTGSAAAISLAIVAVAAPATLPHRLAAAAVAGGLLLAAAAIRPGALGIGDVKLTAVFGIALGPTVAVAVSVAFAAAAVSGLMIIVRRGIAAGRTATMPLGPFLAVGAVTALLLGDPLLEWYRGALR